MSNIITLSCPTCGASINVTGDSGHFKCEYCGNEHILKVTAQAVPKSQQRLRPLLSRPESVRIETDNQSARLVQRWFSAKYLFMIFFCIAWDSFLCMWYSMAIGGTIGGKSVPIIMIIFPIGHLAVGIFLTYTTLAGLVNRTTIELTRSTLRVMFDPMPWIGEKTLPTAGIRQFFCKERASYGKRSTTYTYALYIIDKDYQEIKLLDSIDSSEAALFFEQQLEKWMRIEDQPVVGEVKQGV